MNDKQRLQEAYDIHASVHNWMGYLVCDGEEDLRIFRKWVLKREREAVKKFIKLHNGDGEM